MEGSKKSSNKIENFTAYHRLDRISTPEMQNSSAVSVEMQWATKGAPPVTESRVRIDPTTMYIQGGSIRFHPLKVTINNNSPYRIYYDEYLLFSDCSFVSLSSGPDEVRPNQTHRFDRDISDQLVSALEKNLEVQYKILLSSEPITKDYSNRINQQRYVK